MVISYKGQLDLTCKNWWKLSKDEIKEILSKGKGNMPANIVPADQAAKVADWLSKKNKVPYDKPFAYARACFLYFLKYDE